MSDLARDIARAAERALARARADEAPQWAGVRTRSALPDPLASLDATEDRFYWERPTEDLAIATSGCTHEITASGGERFQRCAADAEALFGRVHLEGADAPAAAGPLLVGGFGFADTDPVAPCWRGFPAARLVLPRRSVARTPEGGFVTAVCRVDPRDEHGAIAAALETALQGEPSSTSEENESASAYSARADRPHAAYLDLIERALDAIGRGELEKVVVARSVEIESDDPFEPGRLLAALRRRHPSCTNFAVGRGDATFLGATPESLLRLSGTRLVTSALAGSAPRGRTPEADAALARELVESKKEQAEHAVVVRGIREALAPHCRSLDVPEAPSLLALESIQHLETRITGELARGRHLLELVADLHPTPAVGGAPRRAALAWLAEHEALERGWYAGAVGFVDATGGGELAVALRSALLRGRAGNLFAGAGIVDGSDPEAELYETRLKLRPLLTQLLEL